MNHEPLTTFFDAHTHAQFAAFADDYKAVIDRALKSGVGLVNVGTQKDTSRRAVAIAHEYENTPIFAAVGLHPIHTEKSYHDEKELGSAAATGFTSRAEKFDYAYYRALARDPKVVAIGECGLDYYRLKIKDQKSKLKIQKQKEAFLAQVELAHEVKKPLMIHCRNAFADLISILNSKSSILNSPPGVVHFFSGTKDDAGRLLDMGFAFTFGGVITFARDYDEAIKMIPPDRILSETDAPYVAPAPHRGKRNEPAYVVEVVKKLAELKGLSLEEMAARIALNARKVFGAGPRIG